MNRLLRYHLAWIALAGLAGFFLLFRSGLDLDYIIPGRLTRLAAIAIGGSAIACSAILFQTIVGNRILTPAVMGYEAVYLLFQSLLVLVAGTQGLAVLGATGNFILSILLMLAYSWMLHRRLLGAMRGDVHLLLLLGLVLGIVIGTFTQFLQYAASPGEFSMLQGLSYTSFNRARPDRIALAAMAVVPAGLLLLKLSPVLDVIALGRDQAIALGVDYRRHLRLHLGLVALLVAVSTSLIGPSAFTGIFIANMSYTIARSARHRVTLPLGCAIAISLFLMAQMAVEHLFNYRTTVGILVNLLCGGCFLALVAHRRRLA
ncbi:iron chelate uptake ABC transporter family permease subunit [Sphingomonas sp. LH128]|uniref:iron chelate uptake ABC transporter family permease subunit n=1 Tax=Sphingomonas sp. LH128 TaxID=473781 RepID=UPI0005613DB0|nr:iron chelate uptake ABC transporter family permease subunit [Sphingomonas sp. LH128]